MSERGTFITEIIGCPDCRQTILDKAAEVSDGDFEIFARADSRGFVYGVIKGTWPGGEAFFLETMFGQDVAKYLCHEVMLAVIPEYAAQAKVFILAPTS